MSRIKSKTTAIFLTVLLTGTLAIMYQAKDVWASGTIYIKPDGSVDPPTASIQRAGDIYTFADNIYETIVVQRDNIIVDGNGYMLQGAGSGIGFNLSGRNNVTIKRTHITQFDYGVYLHESSDNTISHNNLTNNFQRGIFVSNSSRNIISGNKLVNNVREGVFLWLVNTTTLTSNNVSNNGEDGISIGYSSFYNSITNNTIADNNWAGISIGFEISTGNLITGNNITNNVWTGIYIDHSNGNTFYHNNLLYNTNQLISVGATNTWDNGYLSGGNYWSDYTGQDSNGDGIGDTPYVIDANNQDNYPFMNPWTPQAYDIATIDVTPFKTIVGQGYTLHINVTVTNQGSYTQTFNVAAYANTTTVQTQTATLTSGSSTTITFTWDTTGYAKGNCTISAIADIVPGETDTEDNTHTYGTVKVVTPGDVNADGIVNIFDAAGVSAHWYPGPPIGPSGFDPNFDINDDGTINLFDAAIISAHWWQS